MATAGSLEGELIFSYASVFVYREGTAVAVSFMKKYFVESVVMEMSAIGGILILAMVSKCFRKLLCRRFILIQEPFWILKQYYSKESPPAELFSTGGCFHFCQDWDSKASWAKVMESL